MHDSTNRLPDIPFGVSWQRNLDESAVLDANLVLRRDGSVLSCAGSARSLDWTRAGRATDITHWATVPDPRYFIRDVPAAAAPNDFVRGLLAALQLLDSRPTALACSVAGEIRHFLDMADLEVRTVMRGAASGSRARSGYISQSETHHIVRASTKTTLCNRSAEEWLALDMEVGVAASSAYCCSRCVAQFVKQHSVGGGQ